MSECVPCEACSRPCSTCRKAVNPCYKQPTIPDSFAPRRCYVKPTAPVEVSTTYNLSYLPAADCSNLRGIHRKPSPNLVPSCEPMEDCTVQRLSYLPNATCTTQPIRPCNHDMWGQGPMQAVTTQRHDYAPKPSIMRESCKPPPKFHAVESPFETRTVNRLSYINPGPSPPAPSFAPVKCYERPLAKMESSTTQKMSYQPVCAPSPQRPPWACKGQYQKPCQKLDSTTVYRSSFLPPGEDCSQVLDPCSYGDCKPCDCMCPAQCIVSNPCSCAFPRAGC